MKKLISFVFAAMLVLSLSIATFSCKKQETTTTTTTISDVIMDTTSDATGDVK